MAEKRHPQMFTTVGKKQSGKTVQTKKEIKAYINKICRKVLIIDVNNEYKEFDFLPANKNAILGFSIQKKVEGRRISMVKPNGDTRDGKEYLKIVELVLNNFYNGLILLEDVNKFLMYSYNQDILGNICTQRHAGKDIMLQYQGIGQASHPKIVQNTNIIRLHYFADNIWKYRENWSANITIMMIAEKIVKNKYNEGLIKLKKAKNKSEKEKDKIKIEHFYENFVYVDLDRQQITGNYSEKEFDTALENTIFQNEKRMLSPYLNIKDKKTGKPKYTYQQAFNNCFEEYKVSHCGKY